VPQTLQVAAGTTGVATPPAGFTPTDFVILRRETRRVKTDSNGRPVNDENGNAIIEPVVSGGYSVDDPPGGSLPEVEILQGLPSTRLYRYIRIGKDQQFGPVTATVPIVLNGFEPNGVPRLFAAKVDPHTGEPVLNSGAGHCFIPTDTRINDPRTGEILPQFTFTGKTEVVGTFGSPAKRRMIFWIIPALVLLLLVTTWLVLRRRRLPRRH
jgi:hypothetical protein